MIRLSLTIHGGDRKKKYEKKRFLPRPRRKGERGEKKSGSTTFFSAMVKRREGKKKPTASMPDQRHSRLRGKEE